MNDTELEQLWPLVQAQVDAAYERAQQAARFGYHRVEAAEQRNAELWQTLLSTLTAMRRKAAA